MRFKVLAAVLSAAFLSPVAAHAAWQEASSEHFVIYADDNTRDITRFSQQLERYHAGMAHLLNSQAPVPSPSNRVTVYVVRSEREVRELHGGNNKFVGGFYVPNAGGSLAIVPTITARDGAVNWSMVVLLHEYAHHFLISSSAMAMPRWFSEGAAEFFASAKFESDGGVWLGRPAQHRAGELYFAKDVKAADLLDPAIYDKRRHDSYDAFYGKSWLLYHYLTFEPSRAGQLTRYVGLLRGGKSQREAALEAFGDFDVLEKDIDKYLGRSKINALRLGPQNVQIGAVTVRALTPGEAAIMPVRIRSKRGVNNEEANALVVDARAVAARFPKDAAVLSALAECEHDAGNDKEAIAAADAALAIDRTQVNAYVQKGLSLFRIAAQAKDTDAAYKAARRPFIDLNRIENDHPLPLVYFYRSFVEQGQEPPKIALDGLVRATELAPFDLGLRMNLSLALLREGQSAEARTVLQPVAYNPHGGGMADQARAMIERIDSQPNWKGENMRVVQAAPDQDKAGGSTGN